MDIMETRHYSAELPEFEKELMGKRITSVGLRTLILEDGTELVIEDGGDCCAYFEGWFETVGDPTDAVITRVEQVNKGEDPNDYNSNVAFSINIYAAHQQIAKAEVQGNVGSGYYGSSINLLVTKEV